MLFRSNVGMEVLVETLVILLVNCCVQMGNGRNVLKQQSARSMKAIIAARIINGLLVLVMVRIVDCVRDVAGLKL